MQFRDSSVSTVHCSICVNPPLGRLAANVFVPERRCFHFRINPEKHVTTKRKSCRSRSCPVPLDNDQPNQMYSQRRVCYDIKTISGFISIIINNHAIYCTFEYEPLQYCSTPHFWLATHDCVAPYVDIILHRRRF